jgi:peptide/nickel transport system substrate-binding protein
VASPLRRQFALPFSSAIQRVFSSFKIQTKIVFAILAAVFILNGLTLLYNVSHAFTVAIPAPGGTLREGVIGLPQFINPLLAVSGPSQDLTELVYSGLIKKTPEGTYVPDLATYTVSPDYKIYTFVINDDAVFHDGKPVTANDVEFTLTKAVDPAIKSPKRVNWEGIEVTKINDKTIQFTLKQPYPFFLENATLGILPKHIWSAVTNEEFTFSEYNRNPVGSGPYKIASLNKNSGGIPQSYDLKAFKNYQGGTPYISKISMYFYSNEDQLMHAFQKGDIDSMNSISTTNALTLAQDGAQIEKSVLPRVFGVFFNTNKNPALLEKEVRQALSLALDKNELISTVLHGYGSPIEGPLPLTIKTLSSASQSTTPNLGTSIEQATKLLESKGWTKNENNIYQKLINKTPVTLSFTLSTSDVPELRDMAGRLRNTWQTLGAEVELKIFETSDLNQNVIRPRNYEALFFGEVINRDTDLYAFWHSSERNDPGLNIALYTNSKVDKLLEDARSLPTLGERTQKYTEFETEINNDVPAIFVYSPEFVYVIPKNLKGISLENIRDPKDRFTSIETWYRETDNVWKIFASQ